jgi:hypothetical protein
LKKWTLSICSPPARLFRKIQNGSTSAPHGHNAIREPIVLHFIHIHLNLQYCENSHWVTWSCRVIVPHQWRCIPHSARSCTPSMEVYTIFCIIRVSFNCFFSPFLEYDIHYRCGFMILHTHTTPSMDLYTPFCIIIVPFNGDVYPILQDHILYP